jgi:hypothetical protein
VTAGVLFHAEERGDMRMVQGCENFRLALESRGALRIAGQCVGQDLDRDAATELRVPGPVDFAHAAGIERADYFIGAETRALT